MFMYLFEDGNVLPVLNVWPPGESLRHSLFVVGLGQMQEPDHAVLLFPRGNDGLRVRGRDFPSSCILKSSLLIQACEPVISDGYLLRSPENIPIVWVLMKTWSFFK